MKLYLQVQKVPLQSIQLWDPGHRHLPSTLNIDHMEQKDQAAWEAPPLVLQTLDDLGNI